MNFQLAKIGHSFKGSMSYYLHDKRQEQDTAHPETSERVAWTENRNLAVDDAELATGVMIATARQADELKAAAGVSATGRKSTAGPVFAFSLGWHPSEAEGLDRAEMLRAADHALKVLKLDDRQAVIVAHRDTAHPHVHVIVNRVCPQTGKMAVIAAPDVRKLDRWADDYEKQRGHIVSPNRAAKYDEIDQKRAQHPDAEKRRQHVAQQERQQNAESRSRAAILKELGDKQKADHKQQWRDLAAAGAAARDRIYSAGAAAIKEAAARHKAECKPIWASYFREARQAERAFSAREQSIAGVIRNAIDATTHQRVSGQLGNRGTLSATFGNVLSSQSRARAFAERQDMTRAQMADRLKSILDTEIAGIKEQRSRDLVGQRVAFDQARAALIEKQDIERGKVREAWKQIYADRAADRSGDRQHDRARDNYRKPWQKAPAQQEQKPMKDRFDNARRPISAAPAPTQQAFISQAQPTPSPSGDVPKPAPKRLQEIPKTEPSTPAFKRLADAKRDFAPATKPPAKIEKARDWQQNRDTIQQPQQFKRLPARDRDPEPER
jgi:hypothetical protein